MTTEAAEAALPAEQLGSIDLVRCDLEDHASLGTYLPGVVVPGVLAAELVDVPPRVAAAYRLRDVAADLRPVPGISGGVNQHRDPRIAGDVPVALTRRLGIHQDVLPVGVHPRQERLRLPAWHQRHHRRQV